MVQSTESREGVDCALSARSDLDWSTGWRILRESEMRPIFMVVANVLGQHPLEVLLIQDDHVIQQVSSATPDPALCHTVLPRTAKGRAGGMAPQVSHLRNHIRSELLVAIEQKESVRRHARPCLPQLLQDPESIRTPGQVETQNLSPVVADDEETVQDSKGERWDREEVHGCNGLAVVP